MIVRVFVLLLFGLAGHANASTPVPDVPSDAPGLAARGDHVVGYREISLTNPRQRMPDGSHAARPLSLSVWYPAQQEQSPPPAPHCYRFQPPPIPDTNAAVPGTVTECGHAFADLRPVSGRFPVVIISHGYGGWATGFSWLAENLASKGYVVAVIDHRDLPVTDAASQARSFGMTVSTRSADQRFVIEQLGAGAPGLPGWVGGLVDSENIALIGYSMGGFGALATAGADYAGGGVLAAALPGALPAAGKVPPALKAVVLFAPWGGAEPLRAWSPDGLGRMALPALVLVGADDDISTYRGGVDWIFANLTGADRHMIVYDAARHNIAANAAPKALSHVFDYRERLDEPVWRKDRLNAINAHFITAFLDMTLKALPAAAGYFDLPQNRAADGVWPLAPGAAAGADLAGDGQPGYWRGFQRRWATGMQHIHLKSGERPQ